ncbi:tyrosine--tRNA ligase [Mycoplasma mycoides subsp. mycoides]|uniref:Tyrosine--tRNA ligase n=3 Tax=Mycoplasma mycoides TaxID=2102 RepID=SYY_MYCMS|nr:tyrosine--tRNA ligase [Mycoplasma mycoides]Q6MST3.1 RecName: Full=Tyrosine--tRNA ligase; AltName: Full=Tyrosyl-tRNA synthetase; Short=TyrRS [Mycoplasma mycoides subsp. mycoides SC str. PG1]ADK69652.1 tyrosine--tRNA ligase [Mycoplasma mycoides subsp. mycoides SC str. Gladysdale]AIZ55545.1 tyrosyl tRNA synthetase [Mycoplasma mycoides subsp. mycoides]AME10879.1 tyrosine-tRNA ligase [Mycoplasma mycoides subsp. mycoides]AME11890.1 tyrosine-tRNA ligase [Mycoplasma mycoides subsp. mycoides]AME129
MKNSILEELKWRGLIKQITNESKILDAQNNNDAVYCGFDPTADSLHVGHLMMIITLKRFADYNFKPIALIGGATGMIGDPSFKANERVLQTKDQVEHNINKISAQLKQIIPNVNFVNNNTWLSNISLIDFLRDIGKHFNLSYLLAKESIATRIQTGLSVTEFCYTMLQAYDFYYLYKNNNCSIQIGGSDQWGNITSGIDFISDTINKNNKAAGLTINLLTKSDGQKFGKTESGTIWLDKTKTSEYEFYQFWFNQTDQDSINLLKCLTFLTKEQIDNLIKEHQNQSSKHLLQKALASEMTKFVHQQQGLDKALKLTEAFFSGDLFSLTNDLFKMALNSLPNTQINKDTKVIDALIEVKAASSKREAREFLTNKAIMINNQIIEDENTLISSFDLIQNKYLLVKKGKKKYFVILIK